MKHRTMQAILQRRVDGWALSVLMAQVNRLPHHSHHCNFDLEPSGFSLAQLVTLKDKNEVPANEVTKFHKAKVLEDGKLTQQQSC